MELEVLLVLLTPKSLSATGTGTESGSGGICGTDPAQEVTWHLSKGHDHDGSIRVGISARSLAASNAKHQIATVDKGEANRQT